MDSDSVRHMDGDHWSSFGVGGGLTSNDFGEEDKILASAAAATLTTNPVLLNNPSFALFSALASTTSDGNNLSFATFPAAHVTKALVFGAGNSPFGIEATTSSGNNLFSKYFLGPAASASESESTTSDDYNLFSNYFLVSRPICTT
jgi:hypothetical protein